MHELAIAESIATIAHRHARGRRVTQIDLKVGHLRQVVPSALTFAFELLGIDPMYVANEGVFVAIVAPGCVVPGFADIGEVKTEPPGMVLVQTSFGGKRVMDELVGDPLPRIC